MNDALKGLIEATTALRLLCAELRHDEDAELHFTGIGIDYRHRLTMQFGSAAEATPFLAVMVDADWTSETATDAEDGWHRHRREGRWAGAAVEVLVIHRTPVMVDPDTCGCTDCIVGRSTPAGYLSDEQLDTIRAGHVIDRSSGHLEMRLAGESDG